MELEFIMNIEVLAEPMTREQKRKLIRKIDNALDGLEKNGIIKRIP